MMHKTCIAVISSWHVTRWGLIAAWTHTGGGGGGGGYVSRHLRRAGGLPGAPLRLRRMEALQGVNSRRRLPLCCRPLLTHDSLNGCQFKQFRAINVCKLTTTSEPAMIRHLVPQRTSMHNPVHELCYTWRMKLHLMTGTNLIAGTEPDE